MRRVRLNPACAAAQALRTRPERVPQVLTSQELDRCTLAVEGDVPADAHRHTEGDMEIVGRVWSSRANGGGRDGC